MSSDCLEKYEIIDKGIEDYDVISEEDSISTKESESISLKESQSNSEKENDSNSEEISEFSLWDQLPDILLEDIFSYLTIKERYNASQVCRNWYRAFKLQNVWSTFVLEDTTLTRGKFNYYSGWQYVLDHMRTSACFNSVGRNFRTLIFEPMLDFYNLYEFMNMLSWYIESEGKNYLEPGIGTFIRHLKFTFPCNMANRENPDRLRLFGTGGKLLEALKRLMANLVHMKYLELIDLMLDSKEAVHLMDEICLTCTQTLTKLVLINTTKEPCPLLHVGVFLNLHTLVISPQNLDEDVIELLGYTNLKHLHILQNRYSPKDSSIGLPRRSSWMKLRKNNQQLRVHFEIESKKVTDIVLPLSETEHNIIPCQSIVLKNPFTKMSFSTIISHAIYFNTTLKVYALSGTVRYYLDKSFSKRIDQTIVKFCKLCTNLHTLMIRDKISTSTILEIVTTAKSLRYLYVRRNAVLKRCDADWLNIADWTPEHHKWIKNISNDYQKTEQEVSKILGYRWHMLSEKEFESQKIHLHI